MQTGSAHVVIIIGLVVALICALGIAFYQNFVMKNQAATTGTQSHVATKNEAAKGDDSVPATEKQKDETKYLEIKEWSVKFPLTFNEVLSYDISSSTSANIAVKSLTDADSSAQCRASSGGVIVRGTANEHFSQGGAGDPSMFPTFAQLYQQKAEGIGKAGDYYYAYIGGNGASCRGNQESIQNKIKTMVSGAKEI